MTSSQAGFECRRHEFKVVKVVGLRQNFYIFLLYRSPSIDESMYDCPAGYGGSSEGG